MPVIDPRQSSDWATGCNITGRLQTSLNKEDNMVKLIAVAAFALAVGTWAESMTPAPIPQPDSMITQVAYACGPGRTRIGCAWPEPQSAMPADAHVGMEALAFGGTSKLRRAWSKSMQLRDELLANGN
jgi:hypothetical protein